MTSSTVTKVDTSVLTDAFKEKLNPPLTSTIGLIIAKVGMNVDKNWMTAAEITDEVIRRLKLTPDDNEKLYVKQQVSSRLNTMVNNKTVITIGKSGGSFKYTCPAQVKKQKTGSLIDAGFDPEDLKNPLEGIKRLMKKLDLHQLIELQLEVTTEISRHIEEFDEIKQKLFDLEARDRETRIAFERLQNVYTDVDKPEDS